jgi:hypothetical protein
MQAQQDFLRTMGAGIEQSALQGLTDAFIAAGQFNDILAPLQQRIRQITQEAIETGQIPNLRGALGGEIEAVKARVEFLAPLIEEFQKISSEIKASLGGLTGSGGRVLEINFLGPVNLSSKQDVQDFLDTIDAHLEARLGSL